MPQELLRTRKEAKARNREDQIKRGWTKLFPKNLWKACSRGCRCSRFADPAQCRVPPGRRARRRVPAAGTRSAVGGAASSCRRSGRKASRPGLGARGCSRPRNVLQRLRSLLSEQANDSIPSPAQKTFDAAGEILEHALTDFFPDSERGSLLLGTPLSGMLAIDWDKEQVT
jgi:hypothetical protein